MFSDFPTWKRTNISQCVNVMENFKFMVEILWSELRHAAMFLLTGNHLVSEKKKPGKHYRQICFYLGFNVIPKIPTIFIV